MSTLVVFGAGPIGAAAAQQAAARALSARVVLVDPAGDVARGLALDICQSGAVTGTSTLVDGTADESAAVGARVVIVADRHGAAGAWSGDDGLRLMARLRALNPRAFVACASPAQHGVVERAVAELHADPALIAGTGPDALRGAMSALAALEAGVAPDDVTLTVVGRGPRDLFVPWEGASVGGTRASDVLAPPVLARLDRQAPFLWPPGPLSLGAAAARVSGLVLAQRPGLASLFVVPRTEGDGAWRGVAMPATFEHGRLRPLWPVLAPRDRVRFETAARAGE